MQKAHGPPSGARSSSFHFWTQQKQKLGVLQGGKLGLVFPNSQSHKGVVLRTVHLICDTQNSKQGCAVQ